MIISENYYLLQLVLNRKSRKIERKFIYLIQKSHKNFWVGAF